MELKLKLSDEKDATVGWNFDPACLEKIRDEYRERNGDLQTADIEFIDDILSIVWEPENGRTNLTAGDHDR